jgi:carbohydrate-selective porin OprB
MPIPLGDIVEPIAVVALEGSATDEAAVAARSLANLGVSVDIGAFSPWKGASITGVLQGIFGNEAGASYGAWQGYSNIQADPLVGAAEVFLAQELGDVVALRAGRIDGGGSFGVTRHGADFINPSFGVSPTMAGIPTFPEPTWGGEVEATPLSALSLMAGAYAGEGGPYLIGQIGTQWAAEQHGEGSAAAGAWHNGEGTGAFAVVDQQVLGMPGERGLTGFAQLGLARPLDGGARAHLGGGFVLHGPLTARSDDAVGVGVSWAALPDSLPDALAVQQIEAKSETIAEVWYEAALAAEFAIRLDLQGFMRSNSQTGGIATIRTQFSL